MIKSELEEILKLKKIRVDSYSLIGGLPNEAYCLEKIEQGWQTYYSERGSKVGVRQFQNESDACYDLLKRLTEL